MEITFTRNGTGYIYIKNGNIEYYFYTKGGGGSIFKISELILKIGSEKDFKTLLSKKPIEVANSPIFLPGRNMRDIESKKYKILDQFECSLKYIGSGIAPIFNTINIKGSKYFKSSYTLSYKQPLSKNVKAIFLGPFLSDLYGILQIV